MQELAKRVPIKHYVDHGPSVEEREQVAGLPGRLRRALRQGQAHRRQAGRQAADRGTRLADRHGRPARRSRRALPGGGKPNPACADFKPPRRQSARRERPVGRQRHHVREVPDDRSRRSAVEQGVRFHVPEQSRSGTVDLYIVSHHGTDPSGSPALVHGLQPRVAISQNGTRKGGNAADVADAQLVAGLPGPLAAALVVQRRHRVQPRRSLHRQHRRADGDRGRADRASWRQAVAARVDPAAARRRAAAARVAPAPVRPQHRLPAWAPAPPAAGDASRGAPVAAARGAPQPSSRRPRSARRGSTGRRAASGPSRRWRRGEAVLACRTPVQRS